ncbi:probable UBX5 UBX (ubiquitin regulatory X) domain-containing protein [Phialocephala subalpina]|uniref:Probable UBX5 UBX (Ubiquitin regulatory X) domain-containing protein n=1 Tax=Phialocephala subalpina TaxID=576137 RepID=A0A1L7WDH7_9HELO|nr:probable UBX5 UBX (ubiquitin regulatory X) domain-containing protein [Phialocephala subalpina]
MDESIDHFIAFTDTNAEVARRYLGLTDNIAEQAIQLYFDSPDLATASEPSAPPIPTSTRPEVPHASRPAPQQPAAKDDSDDDMDLDHDEESEDDTSHAAAVARAADYEDDEAMARRMQEELYAGGDASAGFDAEGVRAPIGRVTETLVDAHGGWGDQDDMHAAVLQQMRARRQGGASGSGRPGVFNQRAVPSIWDESADPSARREALAQATGGASEQSSKAARLAELFRPPFELMRQVSWDTARDQGKEETKWILVNVQDLALFECQQLNRDIWKHDGIKELVRENFIFIQYGKDDPRGQSYINYYFPLKDSPDAYPHIAIVDPRTGEQVKVWSGPPVPEAGDFLMQLVEFLDRYSLDVTKKNPVARRKPEKAKSLDVDRLTEEEMLDLALQNSLATNGGGGPKGEDPDELTKSFGDVSKGKGKETEEAEETESTNGNGGASFASPFSQIPSNNPHIEPAAGPGVVRIQFRHPTGRVVRRFRTDETVRRIFEWLKAEPLEGKEGVRFDIKGMGKDDLLEYLDETVQNAGLANGTLMVEFLED